jgi:hypothetical protein
MMEAKKNPALAHLTPQVARRVREVCYQLLPLRPVDMSTISPAFAAAVATMRRALEAEPHH